MLEILSRYLAYHLQAANNSFNILCSRPLATLLTAIVIAIALIIPALFWIFTDNLSKLTANWQENRHFSLYLKSSLSSTDTKALVLHIQTIDGISRASLKTASDGLQELQQQEGMRDIMTYLPENPLPAVIDIILTARINTPIKINQLVSRLQQLPQIDQVKIDTKWLIHLHAILHFITKITHIVLGLLAIAVLFIVGNTQRLAIYHRQEEIQVLKLIGATDAFILRPFLYSGVWYGISSAIVALFFVNLFMITIAKAFSQLAATYHINYHLQSLSIKQAYIIFIAAIFLGWLGALFAAKWQLASIKPYN
jgi:cell division transport system permease protein